MSKKRKRLYTLYAAYPGDVKSRSQDYRSGDYILRVRAYSIKQAYALTGKRVRAEGKSVGVISVKNSHMSDTSASTQFFGGSK